MSSIKNASLGDIRSMKEKGELFHDRSAPAGTEHDAEFWKTAYVERRPVPRSVHLKLDPEVFAYFKRQGKGHLTKMQDVLRAYVRANTRA